MFGRIAYAVGVVGVVKLVMRAFRFMKKRRMK
jgi:hypothetical protein